MAGGVSRTFLLLEIREEISSSGLWLRSGMEAKRFSKSRFGFMRILSRRSLTIIRASCNAVFLYFLYEY